uniref:MI domain-containing protein n=1 Tax=Spumella elongata TaxID=89044 RepID=A0A7S3MET0_9STRA
MDLARLSKLLGIDKGGSKKKAASKLNKEFDLYEGMGEGFGDFLMDLDDLTDMVEGKVDRKGVFYKDGADSDDEKAASRKSKSSKYGGGHMIDEDEQEASDIDDEDFDGNFSDEFSEDEEEGEGEEEDEEEGSESEGEEQSMSASEGEEEEEEENSENDDVADDESAGESEPSGEEDSRGDASDNEEVEDMEGSDDGFGSEGSEEGDSEEDEEDESSDAERARKEKEHALFTYKPVVGEDIYGRSTVVDAGAGDKPGKYVPPAKRKAALMEVDESSENVQSIRRQLNGLMNKLSDQSKDSIIRAIKSIFDRNSVTVASLVLKDAILAACAHPTQVMGNLIPIYAAIVAALHCSISIDVGAYMVENLTAVLVKSIADATAATKAGTETSQSSGYIGTKLPANALLLLVYLYNLRVLHHTLIVDIMNQLADCDPLNKSASMGEFVELKVELLECLINHCGVSIRGDDPMSLKTVVNTLSKRLASMPSLLEETEGDAGSSRLRFMFEALTDLKNNKSRRIQTTNAEAVKKLRKWLGAMKPILGQKQAGTSDPCLRVSLQDLLNAETKGRWWRTGASWVGKQQEAAEKEEAERKAASEKANKRVKSSKELSEEEKLLELAGKLGMNSATRRKIFVVMMSSRDVTDAFERLSRLELKGKEDREVARVLAQCCAQERTYNAFYTELAKLLCSQHRQYKITFQFVFWDTFKAMMESDEEEEGEAAILAERKAVNLARMLSSLICSFQLPLTIIKPIDIADLNGPMVLFLSTLLLAMFKEKISEEDFQNVLDRVATSKDFATVRDNILFFLQRYMPGIPKGLDPVASKLMKQRRKVAIRTFEAMSVLDISKGMMKEDDEM